MDHGLWATVRGLLGRLSQSAALLGFIPVLAGFSGTPGPVGAIRLVHPPPAGSALRAEAEPVITALGGAGVCVVQVGEGSASSGQRGVPGGWPVPARAGYPSRSFRFRRRFRVRPDAVRPDAVRPAPADARTGAG